MTLTPLALFDLLENEGPQWLPAAEGAGQWVFQRTVDFAERSGLLQISHGEAGSLRPAATVRARLIPGGGLQGQVRFGTGEGSTAWDLPQRSDDQEAAGAVLVLAKAWQEEIAAALKA